MYSNKKGITLIELIIVMAIIAILAMISIPAYLGQKTNATRAEAYTNLETLRLLEEQFFAENADYTSDLANITAITTALPGFRPGPSTQFAYSISHDEQITDATTDPPTTAATTTPCFVAEADGNAGSRVEDDTYAIDCNNEKNF